MGNSQLLDLARRPVLTELILEALPDIAAGKTVDMSRVYFVCSAAEDGARYQSRTYFYFLGG
jgi:hypothetical protein